MDTFLGFDDFGSASSATLKVTRSELMQDTWFEINGIAYYGPFLRVYDVHVDGEPSNIGHVLVAHDFIRGAVRIGDAMELIRINMNGNLPANVQPTALPDMDTAAPDSAPPSSCPSDGIPLNDGLRAVPPYLDPLDGLALLSDAEMLRSRTIVDADWKAYERWGEHLPAMMVGMTIEMNIAYRYEVGISHEIVGIHLNLIPNYYPNPEPDAPFPEVMKWWDGHHVGERDVLHLFTGFDSSYAQANCIGSVGTTAGYSFSSILWEEQYAFLNTNVYAHEFGHLYAAHHHYGNHVEADLATIMIQGYTPGAEPQFSSVSRSVMRGWAEEYLRPWSEEATEFWR